MQHILTKIKDDTLRHVVKDALHKTIYQDELHAETTEHKSISKVDGKLVGHVDVRYPDYTVKISIGIWISDDHFTDRKDSDKSAKIVMLTDGPVIVFNTALANDTIHKLSDDNEVTNFSDTLFVAIIAHELGHLLAGHFIYREANKFVRFTTDEKLKQIRADYMNSNDENEDTTRDIYLNATIDCLMSGDVFDKEVEADRVAMGLLNNPNPMLLLYTYLSNCPSTELGALLERRNRLALHQKMLLNNPKEWIHKLGYSFTYEIYKT